MAETVLYEWVTADATPWRIVNLEEGSGGSVKPQVKTSPIGDGWQNVHTLPSWVVASEMVSEILRLREQLNGARVAVRAFFAAGSLYPSALEGDYRSNLIELARVIDSVFGEQVTDNELTPERPIKEVPHG